MRVRFPCAFAFQARSLSLKAAEYNPSVKKILLLLTAAAAILVLVVLTRTWLHQPESFEDIDRIQIDLDEAAIARRLAEAVRFRTVSHQSEADFDPEQFQGFIRWVAERYPEFHQAAELTLHGDYSMLYELAGSDQSL